LIIETPWATDRFDRDAKRALEFKSISGPRHKQQGQPRKTTASATSTIPVTLTLPKQGPGRPKKAYLIANMILLPSYQWFLLFDARQGLSDLMLSVSDPTYPVSLSSWSPGGASFQSHFITTSDVELSTLFHLLDDSYNHVILDVTHGATAGVLSNIPLSEDFCIVTNEYLHDFPADFHLDPMQPETYNLISQQHSMHVIIVCPAMPLVDALIPLAAIHAQHVACCLVSMRYFLDSHHSRHAWIRSLRAADCLYIVPAITGSNLKFDIRQDFSRAMTSNVWMLIVSSSSIKRLILKESQDPLSGILLSLKR
jgi:hypothetical protein